MNRKTRYQSKSERVRRWKRWGASFAECEWAELWLNDGVASFCEARNAAVNSTARASQGRLHLHHQICRKQFAKQHTDLTEVKQPRRRLVRLADGAAPRHEGEHDRQH